jgi:hypothetical protein
MKRFKAITIFVTLFFLFACKSEKKERIVNFDPVKKIHLDTVTEIIQKPDSLLFWKQRYQSDSVKINFDSLQASFTRHFLDRFNAKHIIKNKLFNGGDSLLHFRWTFSDTTATKNAFYNWLDCYGTACRSIKLYEPFKIEKQSTLIFLNQYSISYLRGKQNLSKESWINFETTVFPTDSLFLLIVQQPGKNALWYQYKNKKFNSIKK